MSVPLVTICVPTRDRVALLRQSLATILAQDHATLEVIISDNWSSDGTREHCMTLAEADPRVRYTRPAEPIGLYGNHHAALRHARGVYVCFFHDDDLYRPTIISRYVRFLEEHPSVGAVGSDWERIDAQGRTLAIRRQRVPAVTPGIDYLERTVSAGRTHLVLSGAMFRRSVLGDAPFDEAGPLGFTDIVAWCRIAERHDIGHISEVLWSYRSHPAAESAKPIPTIAADHERAFGGYCEEYLARHPGEAARVARWRHAIRRFRFWALTYDVVERLSGRVDAGGLDERIRGLRADAEGPIEIAAATALKVLASIGWRWPFTLLRRIAPMLARVVVAR